MIGRMSARTSPRQAIVVDAASLRSPSAPRSGQAARSPAEEVRRALFLDLLGALVGVNGATISVLAVGTEHGRAIEGLVPPGIDVVTPPPDAIASGRFSWALELHLERAFSRVVAVVADIPALTTRTIATALSTLSAVDLVVGPTPDGRVYLIGVRDELGLLVLTESGAAASIDEMSLAAVSAAADNNEATIRLLERRRRFDDGGLDSLRDVVAAAPVSAPRTAALLRTLTETSPATGHLRHDGASGHRVLS
jgi:hypothetical protein